MTINPFKIAHKLACAVGTWGMERYLALKPLSPVEEAASICAAPALIALSIWINFQP